MKTHYDYFGLKISASKLQIEAAFQHYVSRYRVTADTEMIFTDEAFQKKINAYLVLTSSYRMQYDAAIIKATPKGKKTPDDVKMPDVDLYGKMSSVERRLFMVHAAIWRRQMPSAMHILRGMIDTYPKNAKVWALLAEVYLITDRLEEGIKCLERAITNAPENGAYRDRLDHARLVLDGVVDLYIDPTPEERLLIDEKHARQKGMLGICALAAIVLVYAFLPQMRELSPTASYSLYIPWNSVFYQAIGLGILAYGLAYGRMLPSFEKQMIHATLPIFDRGSTNNYPYGMLLMIASTVCIWLGAVTVAVMGVLDEELPLGPSVVVGAGVLLDLATVLLMNYAGQPWLGTLAFGGNLAVLAALTGWWFGTLDMPSYS